MSDLKTAISLLKTIATNLVGTNTKQGVEDAHLIDVAIQALREKAEREKGCEYCAEGEDLAYGHDSMQRTGRIYLDGNLLTADLYSESMAVAVCFCPACGKNLEVKQDERV